MMASFYLPACCTYTHNGSLVKAQCAAQWTGPDVQHSSADLPGNKSWSWAGNTKGLVLPGQSGLWLLAGCHVMLYIDKQDIFAFKRRWTRALLAAATFQGLNGKLIPEWAVSLCSHGRGSSGCPVVPVCSGAARGVSELALVRVTNHTKSTFYLTVVPPTSAWC